MAHFMPMNIVQVTNNCVKDFGVDVRKELIKLTVIMVVRLRLLEKKCINIEKW
jgi:hypothetical protein